MEYEDFKNPEEVDKNTLNDLVTASYKRNREAEKLGEKNGYVLDHKLSNSQHKVFYDPVKNSSTVAFTGSRTVGDWLITDPMIALGLGKYTKRYKDSQKVVNQAKEKYGSVDTVGHSLGGYLAGNVKGADKKITINKAEGLDGIGKTISKNQTDIVVKGDIVSPLAYTQKHKGKFIKIENNNLNPLVSHDFRHVKKL